MKLSLGKLKKIRLRDLKKYQYAITSLLYGAVAVGLFLLALDFLSSNIDKAFTPTPSTKSTEFEIDIAKFEAVEKKLGIKVQ